MTQLAEWQGQSWIVDLVFRWDQYTILSKGTYTITNSM